MLQQNYNHLIDSHNKCVEILECRMNAIRRLRETQETLQSKGFMIQVLGHRHFERVHWVRQKALAYWNRRYLRESQKLCATLPAFEIKEKRAWVEPEIISLDFEVKENEEMNKLSNSIAHTAEWIDAHESIQDSFIKYKTIMRELALRPTYLFRDDTFIPFVLTPNDAAHYLTKILSEDAHTS